MATTARMRWYKTGSINLTNLSPLVQGVGTQFATNCRIGDALLGPDGNLYEIENIVSQTELVLASNYLGPNASAVGYAIIPTHGYLKELADRAAELIDSYSTLNQDVTDAASQTLAAATDADQAAQNATAAAASADTAASAAQQAASSASASADAAAASAANAASSAGSALSSASMASSSANTATTKASEASASATSAGDAATAAQNWATKTGSPVSGSEYSAKHHAQAAATSASAAASSAGAASASATSAADSASSASASAASAASSASSASASAASAASSASSASESANSANASASSASTSATNAANSASQASAAKTLAQSYANANQGIEVEPGQFSAKHWAMQAQATVTGSLVYRGAWYPSTGSYPSAPALGDYYKVADNGTVGGVSYAANDSIIYNGSGWDKIDSTDAVTSVAGRVGAVTLTKDDVGLSNVDNTADGAKNVLSASKLTTARTISLSGDASGSVAFDGSANVTLVVTVADDSHNHVIANVDGLQAALDGKQAVLVSGTTIKTINGQSLLGSGNLVIDKTVIDGGDANG